MAENYEKVPIPWLESFRLDDTKTFKTKAWQQRFQQHTDSVYKLDMEPMITRKRINDQKHKDKET